jgi:hypothetical protein
VRRSLLTLFAFALLAAPAGAADPVVVAAGDVACDPGSSGFNDGNGTQPPAETPGRCHMKYTADLVDALAPGYVLGVGDLQNSDGTLAKFNQSYDPSWGRFAAKTYPVPGNHEYQANLAEGYFDYFHDRLTGLGVDPDDPHGGWYSFDVPVAGASWHVVAINSECAAGEAAARGWTGGCAAGSAQEQWLRADLAANRSDCTLAFWHHPLLSSGGNGSTPTSGDSPQMKPIWDDLYADYADIVLSAHRQEYERMAPQDPAGVPRPGRGIREWVVGTGGEILHPLPQPAVPPKPASEVLNNTRFGVLKLTLHGPAGGHPRGWYQWEFVGDGVSGSDFADSGSGDCVGPPPAAAAQPAAQKQAAADAVAPKLSKARLSRRRFRVGRGPTARVAAVRRGTVIGYTLSEAAGVRFKIERVRLVRKDGKRVRRYRAAGTLRRSAKLGRHRLRFSGRVGKRALKPGRYRLTIVATDVAGNRGGGRRLTFTVVR